MFAECMSIFRKQLPPGDDIKPEHREIVAIMIRKPDSLKAI